MGEYIDRQAAIDAFAKWCVAHLLPHDTKVWKMAIGEMLKDVPSAQPERIIKTGQRSGKTLESAIDYLHSVGWLQEHDRILTESAQQEPNKGCWEEKNVMYIEDAKNAIDAWQSCRCSKCGRYDTRPYMYFFTEPKFCSHCGAEMRKETENADNSQI